MEINVAGAGAGKTTQMAKKIAECSVPTGKMIFCVAFTNAAVECIREKVEAENGEVPSYMRICTIHSFLYQELIQPYYYLLYGTHFSGISVVKLPLDIPYRKKALRNLKEKGYLHQTEIPETAKWVVDKKSKDTAKIIMTRELILKCFSTYCYKIFVDEAQDIDKHMKVIFEALDKSGVRIEMLGDPKQDIKGYGQFRALIDSRNDVTYNNECHRCPEKHLRLSNMLAEVAEKQVTDEKNSVGRVSIIFESGIEHMDEFIKEGDYGLVYIQKKNDRFNTHHVDEKSSKFETVRYELAEAIKLKHENRITDLVLQRSAYYLAGHMLHEVDSGIDAGKVVNKAIGTGYFDFDKTAYAKICSALSKEEQENVDSPVISSIDAVKGLEAERCLFVLTGDLAPYLFGGKTEDNKMRHLLYVALTRSLDVLDFLVTKEVEEQYGAEYILSFMTVIFHDKD